MRMRLVAMLTVLVVVSAACGNSKKGTETTTTTKSGATQTTNPADFTKNVPVTAKGVTNSTITVDTIASKTNPLHGKYAEIAVRRFTGHARVAVAEELDSRHAEHLRRGVRLFHAAVGQGLSVA